MSLEILDPDNQEKNPTDEELVFMVQQGSHEYYGVLMERYEAKLLRYGRKFLSNADDIEDLVQDIFIRAYEHIQGFDVSLKFSPWVYRIAHNTFVNALRKHSKRPIFSLDLDTFLASDTTSEPGLDQETMRKAIDAGLSHLEEKYREVLILFYLEELPYKDIADILQVPIGTVGIRLARARAALKPYLNPNLIQYEN